MIDKLEIPDLPKERLEFGNIKHFKIVKTREVMGILIGSMQYIRWRREYDFYGFCIDNMSGFKADHLYEKFTNRYLELENFIEEQELRICNKLGINILDIK